MDVKKILLDAMLKLLKINKIEDITVQMILDESTISRTTFYRYFDDKYDLMTWYYLSYVETLFTENQNWYDFNIGMISIMGFLALYMITVDILLNFCQKMGTLHLGISFITILSLIVRQSI